MGTQHSLPILATFLAACIRTDMDQLSIHLPIDICTEVGKFISNKWTDAFDKCVREMESLNERYPYYEPIVRPRFRGDFTAQEYLRWVNNGEQGRHRSQYIIGWWYCGLNEVRYNGTIFVGTRYLSIFGNLRRGDPEFTIF